MVRPSIALVSEAIDFFGDVVLLLERKVDKRGIQRKSPV